jgi:hypothetical protein
MDRRIKSGDGAVNHRTGAVTVSDPLNAARTGRLPAMQTRAIPKIFRDVYQFKTTR